MLNGKLPQYITLYFNLSALPSLLRSNLLPAPPAYFTPHTHHLCLHQWKLTTGKGHSELTHRWEVPAGFQTPHTVQLSPAAALELAECVLDAAVRCQQYSRSWRSGWAYMDSCHGRFRSALDACHSLRYTLLWLGSVGGCDMPILESLWWSVSAAWT